MARYSIAAVLGCLYVGLSAWFVQGVGESYRRSLRAERNSRGFPVGDPQPQLTRTAPATGSEAAPSKGERPRGTASGTTADATGAVVAKTPSPSPSPAPESARPAEAPTPGALASTSPANNAGGPSPTRPTTPGRAEDARLEPPVPGFVWADGLDLAKLTTADESRLGREIHRMIMTYNRRLETGPYEERVDNVARSILTKRSRKDIEYTFTILDSDAVNAFSHPGGFVYVSKGLFDLIGEDEDYALEFVLGHEIAHVDLKHALQCIEKANAEEKKHGLGTVPQFYLFLAFGYPDKMEYEADAWALRRMMVDLDRSRHDALAFLRKFESYARDNGFSSGRKMPPEVKAEGDARTDSQVSAPLVDNHFRAHTAARKRLAELKALSETIKVPLK